MSNSKNFSLFFLFTFLCSTQVDGMYFDKGIAMAQECRGLEPKTPGMILGSATVEEIEQNTEGLSEHINALAASFNETEDQKICLEIFESLSLLLRNRLLSREQFLEIIFGKIWIKQEIVAKELALLAQAKLRNSILTLKDVLVILDIVRRLVEICREGSVAFPVAASIAATYFSYKNNVEPAEALQIRRVASQIYRALWKKGYVPVGTRFKF